MDSSNTDHRDFALALLHADSAEEVIGILKSHGYWENSAAWRLYGDKEGNFSQAGNQQSLPEAALVEKVINSIDTRLLLECAMRGVDPESAHAPTSVRDAIAQFFEDRKSPDDNAGMLVNWPASQRTEQSRHITLAATGDKPTRGKKTKRMCLTITDRGEGQSPNSLPDTILSLNKRNKQRIPFVQGKFNMGGSGALRFCRGGLQLIITRRNKEIVDTTDTTHNQWAITVVRREEPTRVSGEPIHSEFTYLAPINSDSKPRQGDVIGFECDELPLMPDKNNAYARAIPSGTTIKLYEYQTASGQSNILMKDGLLYALERLMPEIALPIRLHECRKYSGHEGSFETPLSGLVVRLEDGRGDNLEPGFPQTAKIVASGMNMTAKIYTFKQDKASTYLKDEGVIFAVNGQSHGYLPKSIFAKPKRVQLPRLRDSLLVIVDCSNLSAVQREDLFMTSRDRLTRNPLSKQLEREIEDLLRNNGELKKLQQERRQQSLDEKLSDEKPLEEVLGKVLKSSPSLSKLFLKGERLSRPFPKGAHTHNGGSGEDGGTSAGVKEFCGQRHPSFFRFQGREYGKQFTRNCELGRKVRIKFDTDVENGYFDRATDNGKFLLDAPDDPDSEIDSYSIHLEDGLAVLTLTLPEGSVVGDSILVQNTVTDPTLPDPFVNVLRLNVAAKQKRKGGSPNRERKKNSSGPESPGSSAAGISLPTVIEVREGDPNWNTHHFDENTSCHVETDPTDDGLEHTFYISLDNIALRSDMKYSRQNPSLMEAKFKYANVMLGLGMLQDDGFENPETDEFKESVNERIRKVTQLVAPLLIPMIDQLAGLSEDDLEHLEAE